MRSVSLARPIRNYAFVLVIVIVSAPPSCPQEIDRIPNGAVVHSSHGVVRLEVCSASIIHIVISHSDTVERPVVPAVTMPCEAPKFTVSSHGARAEILTTLIKATIDEKAGDVSFFTLDGRTVLADQPNGRLIPNANEGAPAAGMSQQFLLSPGEALYGLGQHQEGFLDLRDIPIQLLQANSNIAIPFLLSTNGYGLLWNNPSLTDFDPASDEIHLDPNGEATFQTGPEGEYGFLLSGNYRNKLRLSINGQQIIDLKNMWLPLSAGAKMHLAANTTYKVAGETGGDTKLVVRAPSDTMTFRSQVGNAVDYYFLYGPAPSRIVAEYRELTGKAPLLPKWAYGFWQCRERYSSQEQLLETAAEFRKRKIPVDVLVQDWQYWGKYGWNAMRFDESAYPNPAEMMSALHKQDFHVVISVWAKFGTETAVDKEFVANNLVLKSAASTGEPGEAKERENWADLFNPPAQKMFWADINRNLFSAGLDGWWLDASEPEGDPLKDDLTFLGAGTKVRNAFPLFETSAVYQGQRGAAEDKRVVILTRSAYTGEQRNGVIAWSGDISANWETLRRQIPAGLSFAMSGFPYWTTDIGGFFRPVDQYTSPEYHELLIRWFQFGAFCPIFRIHGFRSETEMWKYGPEVEKILRQYDELRYRLVPYTYSAAWAVTDRDEIVMKALPFAYPHDESVRQVSDQFLFGDSLLINPITEPHAKTRSVVLPAGENWVDFWTGHTYHGGQTITVEAPLETLPILIKEGSIVPLGRAVQNASEPQDALEIRIYPGKDAAFDLYEDAGDGYGYERGARAITRLRWDDHQKILSIADRKGSFRGMTAKHTLQIVLVRPGYGIGDTAASSSDRNINYDGHALKIDLAKAN
jgi:alpha-D-xyloside xylohydrolase